MADLRLYAAAARSTELTGRMVATAREHEVVVDGPPWNGFPGEEIMPGEMFLGAVASCAVELIQMVARDEDTAVGDIRVEASAELDPDDQPHPKHRLFNRVRLRIAIADVPQARAEELVESFMGRCPLFGTVAVAIEDVDVEVVATGA